MHLSRWMCRPAATGAMWWRRGATLGLLALTPMTHAAAEDGLPAGERLDFLQPAERVEARSREAHADLSTFEAAAPGVSEMLPGIRLTPRDVEVPGPATHRLDLSGTRGFVHAVPASFDGRGESVPTREAVEVPGCFAFQGFPRMHAEFGVPVAHRKSFDVPVDWRNLRVGAEKGRKRCRGGKGDSHRSCWGRKR